MTLKTPAEIADEVCNATPEDWAVAEWAMSPADVRASIIQAVENDRAQRFAPAREILERYDDKLSAENGNQDAFATTGEQEAVSVLRALVDPEGVRRRIAELTAEWERTTGDTASNYWLQGDDWLAGLNDRDADEIVRLIELVGDPE